jgi:hypothetical protein
MSSLTRMSRLFEHDTALVGEFGWAGRVVAPAGAAVVATWGQGGGWVGVGGGGGEIVTSMGGCGAGCFAMLPGRE